MLYLQSDNDKETLLKCQLTGSEFSSNRSNGALSRNKSQPIEPVKRTPILDSFFFTFDLRVGAVLFVLVI